MRKIEKAEVCINSLKSLGLDPMTSELHSVEALSNLFRRSASIYAPCSQRRLIVSVRESINVLVDIDNLDDVLEEVLNSLISYGDLIELNDYAFAHDNIKSTWLYIAPPTFIRRPESFLIVGMVPEHVTLLPDDIEKRILYLRHIRRINSTEGEDLASILESFGYSELSEDVWLNLPKKEKAKEYLAKINNKLECSSEPGDLSNLLILDSTKPVRFYKGRWSEVKNHTGNFIARREQAYGPLLWSYVRLENGRPLRMIDLPSAIGKYRGCDEAWHLQMAIDADRGVPQQLKVHLEPGSTRVIEFFSPVPMWARRRWDAVGEPVTSSGCLFAYRLPESELNEELRFANEMLWIDELTGDK